MFEYLFNERVPVALVRELKQSKEDRIELQYHPYFAAVDLEEVMETTGRQ